VLGDHRRPVGGDLRQRETGADEVGNLGEEAEVAAGGLSAAFDDMAGGDRAGERVVVGSGPAEVGGGRSDDHGGVGDPAGDDDVGAGLQAVHDAPGAEVGVGGQWGAEAELAGARHEVVALDVMPPAWRAYSQPCPPTYHDVPSAIFVGIFTTRVINA